uniref:Hormone-sensitive lipase n=1 Tax=Ganoderma boninense TaxID=34458 RepID=A0A5K1JT51_9APHY|nr:Hormone-sensitive lipase [Ganoderma boninense]
MTGNETQARTTGGSKWKQDDAGSAFSDADGSSGEERSSSEEEVKVTRSGRAPKATKKKEKLDAEKRAAAKKWKAQHKKSKIQAALAEESDEEGSTADDEAEVVKAKGKVKGKGTGKGKAMAAGNGAKKAITISDSDSESSGPELTTKG